MSNGIGSHNFVRDGASRLPPGFRFQPTDEELVFQYLHAKIFHLPLPASIIPDLLHVSNFDPWTLPGDEEQEKYFFTKKEAKYRIGSRTNRSTPSGYWKATSSNKQIRTNNHTHNMGMKGIRKTLVFHLGKPPRGTRTHWFMHEFSLIMQGSSELEEWLICHIYQKDAVSYSIDVEGRYEMNDYHDSANSCSSSSSSSSSPTMMNGVNEVSSSDHRGVDYYNVNEEGGQPYNNYHYQPYHY